VRVSTEYRFAPAILVRSWGTLLALVGLLLLLVGILVGVLELPMAVLTTAVVVSVVLVVAGALLASRVGSLVQLDQDGYRVRWLRGAGTKKARWREVEDVVTASVSGHDCVVLRLRDGRTTTIPVAVLDASPTAFISDLSGRLDKGHGYRRLR
jgi:type II secretory pathway component PulM